MAKEMAGYGIEVLGIRETRWEGMGLSTLQGGEKVAYVGDEEVQQGGVVTHYNECEGKESLNGMDANQQEDH